MQRLTQSEIDREFDRSSPPREPGDIDPDYELRREMNRQLRERRIMISDPAYSGVYNLPMPSTSRANRVINLTEDELQMSSDHHSMAYLNDGFREEDEGEDTIIFDDPHVSIITVLSKSPSPKPYRLMQVKDEPIDRSMHRENTPPRQSPQQRRELLENIIPPLSPQRGRMSHSILDSDLDSDAEALIGAVGGIRKRRREAPPPQNISPNRRALLDRISPPNRRRRLELDAFMIPTPHRYREPSPRLPPPRRSGRIRKQPERYGYR